MRISDWSSDVCSSDLEDHVELLGQFGGQARKSAEHTRIAADLAEREIGDDETAEHEQGHLDDIGQRHRLEPAAKLIDQREGAEAEQGDVLVDASHLGYRDRAQPEEIGSAHV